ncbi:hypothetical protein K2173_008138 [Erythroxylum novogranatense]|uniref:RRM domain-containing protein n=1 Tax=Erythroxylum novogranatense TaxID=1862640 RepID=A0AAV8S960_9ROSI|nr:hypothetical protein K2173_008138 [Erythroxylum novogranatense]
MGENHQYQYHHNGHQPPNYHHQHYPYHQDNFVDQNQEYHQFNNNRDYYSNYDSNCQMGGPPVELHGSGGGGFRFNGRKRGRYRGASPGRNDGGCNAKLYVAPVPRTATEVEIRTLFEGHGSVVEVIIPWDKWVSPDQGFCFVKYLTLEEADRAIKALDSQYIFPGLAAPIKVRYADGERERHGVFVDKLYVGCVNKQASKQEIEEIFSPFGIVEDVYIARDELKQSRGCAFIKFSRRDMAIAAIRALNGSFTMRGCDLPLIVRFADPKKSRAGEIRGNCPIGASNFGSCSQEPVTRSVANFGDSMGGHAVYPIPAASTYYHAQPVSYMAKQENLAHRFMEQPQPPLQQSQSDLCQMPQPHQQTPQKSFMSSQQTQPHQQTPQKSFMSSQQTDTEMQKTQNVEQLQNAETYTKFPSTESNPQTALNPTEPAATSSPQIVDSPECDWSEHACPDGYKYYYNCVTCESSVSYQLLLHCILLFNFQLFDKLHLIWMVPGDGNYVFPP